MTELIPQLEGKVIATPTYDEFLQCKELLGKNGVKFWENTKKIWDKFGSRTCISTNAFGNFTKQAEYASKEYFVEEEDCEVITVNEAAQILRTKIKPETPTMEILQEETVKYTDSDTRYTKNHIYFKGTKYTLEEIEDYRRQLVREINRFKKFKNG